VSLLLFSRFCKRFRNSRRLVQYLNCFLTCCAWSDIGVKNCCCFFTIYFVESVRVERFFVVMLDGQPLFALMKHDSRARSRDGFSHPHQEHMKDTYIVLHMSIKLFHVHIIPSSCRPLKLGI